MTNITGKIAVVTGAGKGIGFAIAKTLLSEGVKVFATSRNISSLAKINNGNLVAFSADLTLYSSFNNIVAECIKAFGGLDVVINNAGYAKKQSLVETSMEDWDMHMAVNVRAPFMLVNAAMPYLIKSDHATIINMCSVVAKQGYASQGAYSASKHALLGYTKVLAKETFKHGIRVHAISPGGVATEMVQKTRPDLDLLNLCSPQEIADIILFLLKNRNGAVIDEVCVRRHTKEPWL